MSEIPVVLASTSSTRQALLRAAGVAFSAVSPPVDEAAIAASSPEALADARALAKALSVDVPGAIVIGSDQVAHIDGRAFGKPTNVGDHRRRLRELRGATHTLTTVAVVRFGAEHVTIMDHARLTFRADVTDAEIDAYVATAEGSYCAGGYAVEGLGANLIARIDGDHPSVLGLPLYAVLGALRGFGWRPTFQRRAV